MNRQEAISYIQKYAEDTFDYWDQNDDHKVGKRLKALAGKLTGYDHPLELAFFVLKRENEQPTLEELRAVLKYSKLPPKEHFARMVKTGLINSKGELTRLYGGKAEPEGEDHD